MYGSLIKIGIAIGRTFTYGFGFGYGCKWKNDFRSVFTVHRITTASCLDSITLIYFLTTV